MLIRSKFEKYVKDGDFLMNCPVDISSVSHIAYRNYKNCLEDDNQITFSTPRIIIWHYDSKEDRDLEYEWIMKEFSVLVGVEEPEPTKPPEPVERPTNPKI